MKKGIETVAFLKCMVYTIHVITRAVAPQGDLKMYRVDKDHTPANRVNETFVALKDFRCVFTKNDLARMFYEEFFPEENFNCKVIDFEIYGMPDCIGYTFCIDMTIETNIGFEKIHFWMNNNEANVYSIAKDISLRTRRVYANVKNY